MSVLRRRPLRKSLMYRDFSLHYVRQKSCKLYRAMCLIKLGSSQTFKECVKRAGLLKRPWLLIGAELFISFSKAEY